MDATLLFGSSNWMVCELVRIFHQVSLAQAQQTVNALVERRLPEIWEVGDKKRVLDTRLRAREQVLLLLYSEADWVSVESLRQWVEYKNVTLFRDKILSPMHTSRLLEFDEAENRVKLSPKGALEVEEAILRKLQ